ncbi:MAG TPA: hypothetical protein DCQ29_14905 [Chitinophagaceae bacterium]|nr:hypothetical protein [Chitinophagaceae bacterium]
MLVRIDDFTSQKLKFWSFISMLLLVFVHGYNLQERYLQPFSTVNEPLTVTTFTSYLLANGLFRFRIPMLFAISGYLFAMADSKGLPFGKRIGKRFKTLLVPYFIWSGVALLTGWLMELYAPIKQLILDTHLMQIDDTRMLLHDYHWYELLGRWIVVPIPYQLWFIRSLFFYNLLYWGIRWCVQNKYARWVYWPLMLLFWLSGFHLIFLEGEGLLFFSLGVALQKGNINIGNPIPKWLLLISGIIFLTTALVKSWLAFQVHIEAWQPYLFWWLSLLHKICIVTGVITMWYGSNKLVQWCMHQTWFVAATAFSFFIYAFHVPLVTYTIDPFLNTMGNHSYSRLVAFLLHPTLIILVCIGVGYFVRKYLPQGYAWSTGGRGL